MKKKFLIPSILALVALSGTMLAVPSLTASAYSQSSSITRADYKAYLSSNVYQNFYLNNVYSNLEYPPVYNNILERVVAEIRDVHFEHYDFNTDRQRQQIVLNLYLKMLDPSKIYFTDDDVTEFEKFYTASIVKNMNVAFAIYKRYAQRVTQFNQTATRILLDMSSEPNLNTKQQILKPQYASYMPDKDYNHAVYLQILNTIIQTKLDKPNFSWDQIRMRIIKGLIFKQKILNNYQAKDVLRLFGGAVAVAADTHSEYYSPDALSEFYEAIQSSFVGIGVGIAQETTGIIKFTDVIDNGPAAKSGQVVKGDEVLAISQDGHRFVSTDDLTLSRAVKLIKGKKDTYVWLRLMTKEGTIKVVKIKRGVVPKDSVAATLDTYTEAGKEFGVLHFGSFYEGLDDDVRSLIKQHPNLQGMIIDLRNNGGGLVNELLGLSSVFFNVFEPIFQVTNNNHTLQGSVKYATPTSGADFGVEFHKPVIVMINGQSASASEIFAAAIQDHRRGILVGSQTYGKGTVQSPSNVNPYGQEYGLIKLTIQKFFRVNGQSTQFQGVTPDLILPDTFSRSISSEETSDNPLPYSFIRATKYKNYGYSYVNSSVMTDLKNKMYAYSHNNADYKKYTNIYKLLVSSQDSKFTPLNYNKLKYISTTTESYVVDAYNKYATLHHLQTVSNYDQLQNMRVTKTLDPYLDMTKQLLVSYVNDLDH